MEDAAAYGDNYLEHVSGLGEVSHCPHLSKLASAFKLRPPKLAPWFLMFQELADQLPYAVRATGALCPPLLALVALFLPASHCLP